MQSSFLRVKARNIDRSRLAIVLCNLRMCGLTHFIFEDKEKVSYGLSR